MRSEIANNLVQIMNWHATCKVLANKSRYAIDIVCIFVCNIPNHSILFLKYSIAFSKHHMDNQLVGNEDTIDSLLKCMHPFHMLIVTSKDDLYCGIKILRNLAWSSQEVVHIYIYTSLTPIVTSKNDDTKHGMLNASLASVDSKACIVFCAIFDSDRS